MSVRAASPAIASPTRGGAAAGARGGWLARVAGGARSAGAAVAARAALCALAAWLSVGGTSARATDAFDPTVAEAFPSTRWARLERLWDPHPALLAEPFIALLEKPAGELRDAFGGARPGSGAVVLHCAAGWDRESAQPPVVLVHGAGVDADASFGPAPFGQPFEGLAAALARAGRRVFAVSFAHPHGDNALQAEALANAIARVRHLTGAARVDLVAHSKGGVACRVYLASAGAPWSTRYRGDVRRYVMLGVPNGGLDVSFAYPNLNYWILEHKTAAPLSWTEGLYWGKWTSFADQALTAPAFPGQPQMLVRWDHRYGRTRARGQYDVDTTYDGGRGRVSVGPGIDRAIEQGGRFMERLAKRPIAKDVEIAALAGQSPWLAGVVGERRGPSDGLVLVASALDLEPLARGGARVVRRDLRRLNHLQLAYHPLGYAWVIDALGGEAAGAPGTGAGDEGERRSGAAPRPADPEGDAAAGEGGGR